MECGGGGACERPVRVGDVPRSRPALLRARSAGRAGRRRPRLPCVLRPSWPLAQFASATPAGVAIE
ncbi:hypothetical protein CSB93_0096 [Pseudomonas paraeruginosa]|uniref:Uncharacterized protein n=1 Tax=Pseudomonas paraeruginosa TaxID=2994495 RepID=A0A2R3IML2_9PSED|nr:hypothetical protein CSB93_0096 [Pseudomonas paraeruginosa]AWE95182.1 hypothetical protein CSC28_5412 [Pseudomonas paraeruginosa]